MDGLTPSTLIEGPSSPTPPEAPLPMPRQNLRARPVSTRMRLKPNRRQQLARLITFGGAAVGLALATWDMIEVVKVGGTTPAEWFLVVVFSVSFGWIMLAATTAVAALFYRAPAPLDTARAAPGARTALIMPVYNEDPATVFGNLAATLAEVGPDGASVFEVFVLSDTRDPDRWVAEEAGVLALRDSFPRYAIWYRRRPNNTAKKAGNVEDFVRRWGGRYQHMVVLDADSIMAGDTVRGLHNAMVADPAAGVIQTAPVLVGGRSLFARAQQFANSLYGPVVARGLAAWQGPDSNYWGHNAIIRIAAFAEAAGLPDLPGRAPWGGHILSHDFVEAALIRRAGWSVTLRPEIGGTYEGGPTSLVDVAVRDRRWAQGNFQHARVLGAVGLKAASRFHMLNGILAYAMSPVWLLLLIVGLVLAAQARLTLPNYFPHGIGLFPVWPVFDSARMVRLFAISMVVLLLPKTIALVRALVIPELRRACGGSLRLVGSWLTETIVSVFLAPIMMLIQTRIVLSILAGRSVGWAPQQREDGGIPLRALAKYHAAHTVAGVVLGVLSFVIAPVLAAWLAPTVIGLVFAIPVSALTQAPAAGLTLARWGLLTIPEERETAPVIESARRFRTSLRLVAVENALLTLRRDGRLERFHRASVGGASGTTFRRVPGPDYALARVKLSEAADAEELLQWLTPSDRAVILADAHLLSETLRRLSGHAAASAA